MMENASLRVGLRQAEAGQPPDLPYLDVAVHNVVVMQVAETLQDLAGVEADGALVVLQGPPH